MKRVRLGQMDIVLWGHEHQESWPTRVDVWCGSVALTTQSVVNDDLARLRDAIDEHLRDLGSGLAKETPNATGT